MVLAFASVAAVQRATGVEAAVSTAAAASLSAAVSLQTIREHIKPASSGHTITTATTSHDNSYHNSYHKKINYWDLLMQNPRGAPAGPPLPPLPTTTINFDAGWPLNQVLSGSVIVDGFTWQGAPQSVARLFANRNFAGIGCDLQGAPSSTSGWVNGIVSKPVALAVYRTDTSTSAGVSLYICGSPTGKAFIPQSVQATSTYRSGMTLTFAGYNAGGTTVSSLTAVINYDAATKIDLTGLGQIYSMSIASSGGSFACYDWGTGYRDFLIDDFVFAGNLGSVVSVTCPTVPARQISKGTSNGSAPGIHPHEGADQPARGGMANPEA